MEHVIKKGYPIQVNWTLHSIAGEEFSLQGYTTRLYYANGSYASLATTTFSGNTLTWSFTPTQQWKTGDYDIFLEVYSSGTKIITLHYPKVFALWDRETTMNDQSTVVQTSATTININSSCDFYRFAPVVPVVGDDGYWYVNGQKVTDGSGEYVLSSHTLEYDAETGYLIIDRGRTDAQGHSIQQTITDIADIVADLEDKDAEIAQNIAQYAANEAGRVSAESLRVAAEASRASAEAARATAETARASAESSRASAETARASAENARISAENARATAETTRANNETSRKNAETLRASAESSRATAETARATAETARASAELARASAEADREEQAASDHTAAVADHSQASTDHSTAASDHTQASQDHTIAASDHTQAASDHTTAASDHTQAASDHTTAASDHTTAAADHTQAASDHTTAAADHTQALADHEVMQGYDDRLTDVEEKVIQTALDSAEFSIDDTEYSKEIYTSLDDMSQQPYSLISDTNYGTGASYKHGRIMVRGGDIIEVTTNANNLARLCFLKDLYRPISGGSIRFVEGTVRISQPAGTTQYYKVPEGAECVAIYAGQDSAFLPSKIVVYRKNYEQPLGTVDYINSNGYKLVSNDISAIGSYTCSAYPLYPNRIYRLKKITVSGATSANDYAMVVDRPPSAEGTINISQSHPIPGTYEEQYTLVAVEKPSYLIVGVDPAQLTVTSVDATEDKWLRQDLNTLIENQEFEQVSLANSATGGINLTYSRYIAGQPDYQRYIISVDGYRFVRIKANSTYSARYAFLKSDSIPPSATFPDYADNEYYKSIPAGEERILSVPPDAKYMFIADSYQTTSYKPEYVGLGGNVGVSGFNDDEYVPKLLSANKRYYTSTTTDKPTPLVMLHISDIHGNWKAVDRYLKFHKQYKSYINLLVNTGDTVGAAYTDGIEGYAALTGAEQILNVIGNHDTAAQNPTVWQEYIGLPAYNMLIKPFVENWGVTQPENADENGYCYYYKDYASRSLRVIAVDVMAYDATQDAWLSDILDDALTQEMHVVILTHFSCARPYADRDLAVFTKLPCAYTSLYGIGSNSEQLTAYNTSSYLMARTVDSFIQDGGHFVGYIQGHYHTDVIARNAEFPNQMIYTIGASMSGEVRDFKHVDGTRFQDEFQIVSIDTVSSIIKLFKVGANIDRYGRIKESVCVNYNTGEIIGVDATFEALKAGLADKYVMPAGGIPASDLAAGVVPTTATEQPSGGMLPNVVYELGELDGDTTFLLAAAIDNTMLNHWYWTFDTPSTAPSIIWPSAVTRWAGGSAPTIAANKHYEISVINGVAAYLEV